MRPHTHCQPARLSHFCKLSTSIMSFVIGADQSLRLLASPMLLCVMCYTQTCIRQCPSMALVYRRTTQTSVLHSHYLSAHILVQLTIYVVTPWSVTSVDGRSDTYTAGKLCVQPAWWHLLIKAPSTADKLNWTDLSSWTQLHQVLIDHVHSPAARAKSTYFV